ncbi:DUF5712 family protein [Chryseobacterium oncorhynchi]|uniref:Toprim domain-containing protein n=1 Tax=Chryseobacterium oncorhynchi TaxID=741074 RepID=A0A316WEW8_9FLAO|nr:DUF5712 family protein [Chryseobacterium oncorhynchi]PWN59962.1 hypothetical protein C1638_020560 [Chryseobacterium oncorhynchi]
MYVDTHLIPLKKEDDSNKGSCGKLIEYLSKDNDFFFNHSEDDISKEKAQDIIDKHSKGRLGKGESKWYSPMYSFSNDECKHIVNKLFDKDYNNYSDLSDSEKQQYNDYFIFLGRRFQDQMAYNFEKSDLGINSGSDLVYVGVVEHDRTYKSHDEEVRVGLRKVGEDKPGFNTHIHIVQSRKANNEKQSKISPESNYKSRTKENFGSNSKSGFDRNNFYNLVEGTFDNLTKFKRNQQDKFEFKKLSKNIKKENKKNMASNFIPKEELAKILEDSSIVDYFFSLADKGVLRYDTKKGDDYIFAKHDDKTGFQTTGSISVSPRGFRDFSNGDQGQIIKAVQIFENLNWLESIHFLKNKNGFIDYEYKNNNVSVQATSAKSKTGTSKSNVEIIKTESVSNKYIIDYYKSRGISEETIKNNVKQIVYKRDNKTFISGGIDNIKGGYNVRGHNFKSIIGGNNDISIIKGTTDKLVIFEGLVDFLSWLEINKISKTDHTVILTNSTSNYKSVIDFINSKNFKDIDLLVNKDAAGDDFTQKLDSAIGNIFNDLREHYELSDKVDLNDKLIIDQVKGVSQKGFKI